eukprot:TRINITY_DN1608_c0_g5_i1.p1 TRINITY_DN1608_c0_g5~~TRINITY_DN1608_c0_g5_i1.p1  ORF type:complete len:101 (+),score=25.42 TRINITY_DN1608_c0_g5_i1:106-408(+)
MLRSLVGSEMCIRDSPGIEEAVLGKGMPIQHTESEYGDMIVRVALILPSVLRASKQAAVRLLRVLTYLFCAYVFFTGGGNIFICIWIIWCFNRFAAYLES